MILATEAVPTQAFSSTDALTTLLTIEGLVFAALAIAIGLAEPKPLPTNLRIPAAVLAVLAATVLTIVAAGAIVVWVEIFWTSFPGWPPTTNFSAWAIFAAIIGLPIMTWAMTVNVFPERSSIAA